MDNSKRRVGRPKSEPRTGPLVLAGGQDRQRIEVELTAETANELAEYAGWVEESSSLPSAEATFTTVEYALREVFRRDRLWRERRQVAARPSSPPRQITTPTPAASPPRVPSPSLPPPPARAADSPVTSARPPIARPSS
jgi:hypothetical protein